MNIAADAPVLVTGGAGFVGCNLADRLLRDGHRVIVYDNLSRRGVEDNLEWLKARHGERVQTIVADVSCRSEIRRAVAGVAGVFHLAAQVAVTTSLEDPFLDFDSNLRGTLELLEALRALENPPPLIFTSTNKVYGCLPDIPLRERERRWEPCLSELAATGISEARPLEFRSPYGCSKGAADQYVLDYAKTFGLPCAVFRMSCIYGPHQLGTEDQGWVAHFLIRALKGEPITIFGDGKQVRDILFVDDLVEAFLLAFESMDRIGGQAFNVGGGPFSTLSLLELVEVLAELEGRRPELSFASWRTGDQRYYVSDTRAFRVATGWRPQVPSRDGVERLHRWLAANSSRKGSVQNAETLALAAAANHG